MPMITEKEIIAKLHAEIDAFACAMKGRIAMKVLQGKVTIGEGDPETIQKLKDDIDAPDVLYRTVDIACRAMFLWRSH